MTIDGRKSTGERTSVSFSRCLYLGAVAVEMVNNKYSRGRAKEEMNKEIRYWISRDYNSEHVQAAMTTKLMNEQTFRKYCELMEIENREFAQYEK